MHEPTKEASMPSYLIIVPLPESQSALAEPVLRSAACFLEAHGAIERQELGTFRRSARGGDEVLTLVRFTMKAAAPDDERAARGRALEGVLRATLVSAGLRGSDARVFVSAT